MEPRRLKEGGGGLGRLLESASLDVPSAESRRRADLLASTATSFSSPASGTQQVARLPRKNVSKTLVTWMCIGAAASVALGLAGTKLLGSVGSPATASNGAPMAELSPAASGHVSEISAEPVPTVAPLGSVEPWVPTISSAAGGAEEVRQLEAARVAVSRGDGGAALRILDKLDQAPARKLQAEAIVLRVQALLQAGKADEARAVAKQFLEANPEHPLRTRLEPVR